MENGPGSECVCVGRGKQNRDRCHRAVVMPKLIHSASRCFHTKKERVGSDVQEMDPLGNGPCPACCTLRLTLGGSRGWRGTWESGGGSESRSTGHRTLWSALWPECCIIHGPWGTRSSLCRESRTQAVLLHHWWITYCSDWSPSVSEAAVGSEGKKNLMFFITT